MKDAIIIFRLKRFWEGEVGGKPIKNLDLWEEIKQGRKTSEWRDITEYWTRRLYTQPLNFTIGYTRVKRTFGRVWFTCGYPKHNLPRLEADYVNTIPHLDTRQYEIVFANVTEVPDFKERKKSE